MTRPLPAPLSVEQIEDRAGIAALAPEWERLRAEVAGSGGTSGPFLGPTWFGIWAASLNAELRLIVAHRAGNIVGILPLLLEERFLAGLPAKVLRSLSDDHSQRFDVLLSPIEPQRVAAALWRHIAEMRGWDALELREIPDESPSAARLLAEAQSSGFVTHAWRAMTSPYLPLAGLNDRGGTAKFRSNLRRRKKKLEAEVGPLALERVESRGAELDAALDEGLALEAAGWKGPAGTAIACNPRLHRRYRQLAHAYRTREELALYFLRAGDRRIAFHFGIVDGGTYFLFKPGFDPALSTYGLGHLLVDAVIADLAGRGVRELDFLGDDMPWKRDWTDQRRAHSWRYVFSRSPYGRLLGTWRFGLVPRLKRLLRR